MRLDWRGVTMLAAVAIALSLLLVLIVWRVPIAERAVVQALAWRGVDAGLRIAVLDFDRAVIEGLRLGPPGAPAVAADRIEARYGLWGLIRGRPRAVTVEGLAVRVTVDGRGARLVWAEEGPGAARRARSSERRRGRPAEVPAVSVAGGRLVVATPAGEVTGDIEAAGGPRDGWTVRVAAHPARLRSETASLALTDGRLEARVTGADLTVEGNVGLASYEAGGALVRDSAASLTFAGTYADPARLDGLTGHGEAAAQLHGSISAELAERWTAALAPDALAGRPGWQAVETLIGAHREALRTALVAALQEVDADAALSLAVADGRATAAPERDAVAAGAGGARLALASSTDIGGALVYDARSGEIAAHDLALSLHLGEIDAHASASSASLKRERGEPVVSATLALSVAPWLADGLTLAADASRIGIVGSGAGWTADVEADATASGGRFGVTASDAAAHVSLRATMSADGLAIAPAPDAVQELGAQWVGYNGLLFQTVGAEIAPTRSDAPFLRLDADGLAAEMRLGKATAEIDALGGHWTASLPAVELAASLPAAGDDREPGRISAYVQAPRLDGALPRGAADVRASVVDLAWGFGQGASAQIRFDELTVDGAASPARLEHATGELVADLEDGKPYSGRITLTGGELSDTAQHARFVPLSVRGDAPIERGQLAGAFTAVDSQREILRAEARHDFRAGAGAVTISTPVFTFAPGGLQPHDLSPVLRTHLLGVSGAAQAEARFAWDPAGLQASGLVTLDGAALDTRFGRIEGLSTRFEIGDLLALKTDSPQRIAIGLADPGLPLRDGVVDVELLGPGRAHIADARFPLAGGALALEPADIDWTLEGQQLVLDAEGVSLGTLADLLHAPRLEVAGAVSGRLPVTVRGRSVTVEGGLLASDGAGRVSFAARSGAGSARGEGPSTLAFDALRGFDYDRLTLTLDGDVAGRLDARVRLEGHNPDVLEGAPVDVDASAILEPASLLTRGLAGVSLSAARREGGPEGARARD